MSRRNRETKRTQRRARTATPSSQVLPDAQEMVIQDGSMPEITPLGQITTPTEMDSKNGRRKFTLLVQGVIPGIDITTERQAILAAVEEAITALRPTHNILLLQAGYRSDPMSALTAIAQGVPDTNGLTKD